MDSGATLPSLPVWHWTNCLTSLCCCFYISKMAPHSSTLAWRIPWTEEPGGLRSTGSLRVGHDWETSLSLFAFMHWKRKWQPTPVFLPRESQGRGSLGAAGYGVAQSQTRLKRLSSSSKEKMTTLYQAAVGLRESWKGSPAHSKLLYMFLVLSSLMS